MKNILYESTHIPNNCIFTIMIKRFKEIIETVFSIRTSESHFILAVSGGLDSRTMAELFSRSGYQFSIAHVNFQLRAEAVFEEEFVRKLAEGYNCQFHTIRFDTEKYALDHRLSVQEAARELRYRWFSELASSYHQRHPFVVTAHHANDDAETLLINFFRGSGIHGLSGIPQKQGNIIRPLLEFKRKELQQFAENNGLEWMEDQSNLSNKYTRNFYRLDVIPLLEVRTPDVIDILKNNIARFRDVDSLYNEIISEKKKKLCKTVGKETHIPILLLQKTTAAKTVLWEIIKEYGYSPDQVNEVWKLFGSDTGRYVASENFRIFRNRKFLVIAPKDSIDASTILIPEKTKNIIFPAGKLQFRISKLTGFKIGESKNVAWIDADEAAFPMILRKWKTGDYFYPLGMPKKKKLSRFFVDQKLSLTEKEKVWVLESDKKIIWVIGLRIDDRVKITDKTHSALRIDFSK